MATTTKDYDSPSVAARLHLVEEKLKAIVPPEGEDLTAVIAGLNRVYEFLLRGSQRTIETDPITYSMTDDQFWFGDTTPYRSIVSVTYGNEDQLNRVADVPFFAQVLGVSADWDFAAIGSEDQDEKALVGVLFGAPSKLADLRLRNGTLLRELGIDKPSTANVTTDHGSVLGAMYGGNYGTDPDARTRSLLWIIRDLESQLGDLRDRVQWLEDNP
ncbi:hypothetical protein Kim5_CH00796 [Rhizobium sp. Kim5]|uniref:hypothetical protein n=1 Tax=Rhizobium sp. Kim5 TaxID=2020311 RepID=UPI0001908272|nr:hypothetical protein [Rhizobium sp. Kim5]ARQ56904.1 hypothetical protein Kim5_CH00796 [Rhizobium sp. Kim5]